MNMRIGTGRSVLGVLALLGAAALLTPACSSDDSVEESGVGGAKGSGVVDSDGDGVADVLGVGVDKDGDGVIDDFDINGDGSVVGPGIDTDGDGEPDAIGIDTDGDGIIDALDTDGDGKPDVFATGGGNSNIVIGNIGGSTGGGPVGNGEPEVCDGKDNDGDGIIDNVDAGGDGICDCLNIGTVGRIGPWGAQGGDIFQDWLNTRSPIPAKALGDDELTAEALAGLDIIVVLRADTADLSKDSSPAHHAFSDSEVTALETWVKAGGGLMTTIGYQNNEVNEVVNVNKLLAPFDVSYDGASDVTGYLTNWSATHPIANGVSNIYTANGSAVVSDVGEVVATSSTDVNAMMSFEPGDGHVIVFGDEWITYDDTWADVQDQQIELLWLNMFKWMSPPKKCQVAIPPDLIR